MRRFIDILIAVAIIAVATSCSEEKQPAGANWGVTEWYEDKWYYGYEPTIMTKTIEIELNSDAWNYLDNPDGYIELSVSASAEEHVAPDDIKVYFNGEAAEDGKFKINYPEVENTAEHTENGKTVILSGELGIEFLDNAEESTHQYHMLYTGRCQGNDKISADVGEIYTDAESIYVNFDGALGDGIYVEKINKWNPADVILMWIGIILGAALILWLCIGRYYMYPRITIQQISLLGPKSNFTGNIRVNGLFRVVFTPNKDHKQSLWHRIFVGKILYVVYTPLKDDITFQKSSKDSVFTIVSHKSPYMITPRVMNKRINNEKNPGIIKEKNGQDEIKAVVH